MQQQQLHYFEWKALLPRSARAHLNMYNGGEGQWKVRESNERGLLFLQRFPTTRVASNTLQTLLSLFTICWAPFYGKFLSTVANAIIDTHSKRRTLTAFCIQRLKRQTTNCLKEQKKFLRSLSMEDKSIECCRNDWSNFNYNRLI